ncbi:MAG: ATP-binding cassette domain-containing protein, partial [Tissierellia bacterium]|nr:ATP-binding cassette domain-containing protein [Tissierellia bacterium]
RRISRIFQDPSLGTNPSMTIYENLSMAKNKGNKFGLSFLIDKKDEEYFKELLKVLHLGLEDKLHTPVSQLSGGQRQSLALIMAVLGEPELLLLDEHTAALDPKTSEIVMEITDKIVKEKGLTTIMVTHNVDHALRYGNRLIMLHRGNKLIDISGETKNSLTKEELLGLFKDISDKSLFS